MKINHIFKNNRGLKIFLSIVFTALTFILLYINNSSLDRNYQSSIFDGISLFIPLFLISIMLITIIFGYLSIKKNNVMMTLFIFFAFVASIFILTSLPLLKDYYIFGRGDVMTHLGIVRDIINNGHIGNDNFYPLVHIELVEVTFITGIGFERVALLFAPMMALFSIGFTVILCKSMHKFNNGSYLIVAATSMPIVLGSYVTTITPAGISVLFIPLFIYIYLKTRNKTVSNLFSYTVILVILSVSITFFHTVITAVLIVGLIAYELSGLFIQMTTRVKVNFEYNNRGFGTIFLMICTWITWISLFSFWKNNVINVVRWLTSDARATPGDALSGIGSQITKAGYNATLIAFNEYGGILILTLISGLVSLYIIMSGRKRRIWTQFDQMAFMLLALQGMAVLFLFTINLDLSPTRLIYTYAPISTAILGIMWLRINEYKSKIKLKKRIVQITLSLSCVFIVVIASLSIFPSYPDQNTLLPNPEVTGSEVSAVSMFFSHKDLNITQNYLVLDDYRFANYVLGYQESLKRSDISSISDSNRTWVPDHFGRFYGKDLRSFYQNDSYLLISEYGQILETKIWSKTNLFTDNDFREINLIKSKKIIIF